MTNEEFNRVVEECIEQQRKVLTSKADEYARGDRLSNFKAAGRMNHTTPEAALWGFVTKHIIALGDFIRELDKEKVQSYERWAEKIRDIQNYMTLLDGLVQERIGKEPKRDWLLRDGGMFVMLCYVVDDNTWEKYCSTYLCSDGEVRTPMRGRHDWFDSKEEAQNAIDKYYRRHPNE